MFSVVRAQTAWVPKMHYFVRWSIRSRLCEMLWSSPTLKPRSRPRSPTFSSTGSQIRTIIRVSAELNLGSDKCEPTSADPLTKQFVHMFAGAAGLAARRAGKALSSLRGHDGLRRQLSAAARAGGGEVGLRLSADENPRQ
eukprot:4574811-Pyramimonas_sp.AAC.1